MPGVAIAAHDPRARSSIGIVQLEATGIVRTARLLGTACAWVVVASAVAVLLGWAMGDGVVDVVMPGAVAMNPLTAVCFLVSAVATLSWREERAGARRSLAIALALAVATCGVARVVAYLIGWDVPIDRTMFSSQLDLQGVRPNRMVPNTALNFTLLGTAIALQVTGRAKPAQLLTLAAWATAFVAVTGYAYEATQLVQVASFIPMALHTAVLFLALGVAVSCSAPSTGWMAALTGTTPGGRVIRRMLAPLLIGPPVLGWLRLRGQSAGLYDTEIGVALFVGVMSLMGVALTWWAAAAVDREEAERKRAEELILQMAHFDSLTALPNRLLFEDRLRRAVARARRAKGQVAVLFLDLDGFKRINDTQGHQAGDQVLREAARRIEAGIRAVDTAARLGGDEFTVVLEQITTPSDIHVVAQRLRLSLAQPYSIDGIDSQLSVSVGASVHPRDGETVAELLLAADAAMYRAKRAGKNQVVISDGEDA